jgi:citrate lyase subunit beta / citryl-CoA lyase
MRSILVFSAMRALPAEALDCGASAILLRLDARGKAAREEARARARGFVEAAAAHPEKPRLFAQIAAARSELADGDLAALACKGLDGVFLEACEGRDDVQQISARLAVREAESRLPHGGLKIVALAAQTPTSIFGLGGYRGASARLEALAMDEAAPPGGAQTLATARVFLVLGAAAAGLPALDASPSLRGGALAAACEASLREGFSGAMGVSAEEIDRIAGTFGRP